MVRTRLLTAIALAAVGVAGVTASQAAHARGERDVQWTVTIGSSLPPLPRVVVPAPVVIGVPAPVRYERPVHRDVRPAVHYRQPTRWDHDGDGIPNRYDRVYNPVWDVDGDGIPNRRDRVYNPPHEVGHGYGYGHGHDNGRGHGHGDGRDRDRDGVPDRHDPTPNGGWRGR